MGRQNSLRKGHGSAGQLTSGREREREKETEVETSIEDIPSDYFLQLGPPPEASPFPNSTVCWGSNLNPLVCEGILYSTEGERPVFR